MPTLSERRLLDTEGRVQVSVDEGSYGLTLAPFEVELGEPTRQELLEYLGDIDDPFFLSQQYIHTYDDSKLHKIAAKAAGREKIGGLGITRRTLTATIEQLPTLLHHVEQVGDKKIDILGNGLSLAWLELLLLLRKKQSALPQIVLHDAFSYQKLLGQLLELQQTLPATWTSLRYLNDDIVSCQTILEAAEKGTVQICTHIFGYQLPLPPVLQQAELVINVFGPPKSTYPEQLQLLTPTGTFLHSTPKNSFR